MIRCSCGEEIIFLQCTTLCDCFALRTWYKKTFILQKLRLLQTIPFLHSYTILLINKHDTQSRQRGRVKLLKHAKQSGIIWSKAFRRRTKNQRNWHNLHHEQTRQNDGEINVVPQQVLGSSRTGYIQAQLQTILYQRPFRKRTATFMPRRPRLSWWPQPPGR